MTEVEAAGKKNNPDLRAALAAYEVANHEVTAAWGGLLPALSVDYFYGIDSNKFAIRTDGVRNLGYSDRRHFADSDLQLGLRIAANSSRPNCGAIRRTWN